MRPLPTGQFGWILPSIVAVSLFLSINGCKPPVPAANVPTEKASVVATAYPLADVAREIGGDFVQASWILEDGQSPDALQITPKLEERLTRADLLITCGASEPWAVEGYDDPGRAQHIVRLDLTSEAQFIPNARQLWLDPVIVRQSCDQIAQKLTVQIPSQVNLFKRNAEKYSGRIDDLMREFASGIQAITGMKVLVLSHDFSALNFRLKLVEVMPVNASPLRLTDSDMAALHRAVEAQRPSALLLDINTPLPVQRDLASRLGVPVILIDALGSSAANGHNMYLSLIKYDFEQLTSLAAGNSTTRPLAASRDNFFCD